MGRYFWLVMITALTNVGIGPFQSVWAYVPTITSSGVPIRWKTPVHQNFVGNPTNQSQVTPDEFYNAAVSGLQRWKVASTGSINFDYWQGTNPRFYPPTSDFKNLSSIYFASNASGYTHLSPNVLGMTQVWYNTDSGEILETDIVLNDIDFRFTNNPRDTSGYGAGNTSLNQGKNNVYIQNVVTHELGHTLGLSHSGGLQSTMLFMESPEQAHLGCDELIAIHALYPSSDQNSRGSIAGFVTSESGGPIFGAHVLAISQKRGTVLATSISNRAGQYVLNALEPGTYFIMAEPFYAGSQALPSYYSGLNSSICQNGTSFSRSFLTERNDFSLVKIGVKPSEITAVPPLTVRCDGSGGASISENPLSTVFTHGPIINQGSSDENSFGIVDRFNRTNVNYYRLFGISGRLEIHAIAYSLYSPIHSSISLLSAYGSTILAQMSDPIYTGDSGYINHDSAILAEGLPEGDYILRVSSDRLLANAYPAGPVALDSVPFIVITGSVNEQSPALTSVVPPNARCRMQEDFPIYKSPPGLPPHSSAASQNNGTGLCGTLNNTSQKEVQGPNTQAIIGWLIPWLFMLFFGKAATYLHRNTPPVNLR